MINIDTIECRTLYFFILSNSRGIKTVFQLHRSVKYVKFKYSLEGCSVCK